MSEQPYEAEALLQKLLADHPDLLAGDQINAAVPRRWLFIGREIGVPGEADGSNWWSLDHLFLDQDSVPTFIEVKRSSDTRARREVVAQMLDYAANAVTYWPASRMRELYAQSCDGLGLESEEYFHLLFDDEVDAEEFWARADQNLRAGRVRLLFVSDRIPSELRRVVEFLNGQMNPAEVLALEVKQYVGPGDGSQLRTLVPRIIGQTEVNREQKRASQSSEKIRALVPVDEFASLPELQAYRLTIERLLQIGSSSQFEVRPHVAPKSNQVRYFAPGSKGETFSIVTDGYCWLYFQSHERTSDPILKKALKEILVDAFPEKKEAIDRSIALNTYIGFRFDQIASESGLAAIEQALRAVEKAIFGVQATSVPEIAGGS